MKSKLLSALLCTAMVATMLVGCGPKEEGVTIATEMATENVLETETELKETTEEVVEIEVTDEDLAREEFIITPYWLSEGYYIDDDEYANTVADTLDTEVMTQMIKRGYDISDLLVINTLSIEFDETFETTPFSVIFIKTSELGDAELSLTHDAGYVNDIDAIEIYSSVEAAYTNYDKFKVGVFDAFNVMMADENYELFDFYFNTDEFEFELNEDLISDELFDTENTTTPSELMNALFYNNLDYIAWQYYTASLFLCYLG
ncbi:MAG: hypothetical protein ACRC7V_09955 [Lachnospiraceae bacterium]